MRWVGVIILLEVHCHLVPHAVESGRRQKPAWLDSPPGVCFSFFFGNPPKTLELRNNNCRCVKPGSEFHIVESGHGKNKHGLTVVKVLGTVEFEGNMPLEKDQLQSLSHRHRVSSEQLVAFMDRAKKVVAWQVCNAKPFPTPKWLKWNNQERRLQKHDMDIGLIVK